MATRRNPKCKPEALRLAAKGVSTHEIAKRLAKKFRTRLAESTVRKWVRDSRAVAPVPESAEDAPSTVRSTPNPEPAAAPSAEPAAEPADILEQMRAIIGEQKAIAEMARRDGNTSAAQRALRAAGEAAQVVARLEAKRKDDTDAIVIPRADYERASKWAEDTFAALRADLERTGGLVCTNCGRAIRLALASELKEPNK